MAERKRGDYPYNDEKDDEIAAEMNRQNRVELFKKAQSMFNKSQITLEGINELLHEAMSQGYDIGHHYAERRIRDSIDSIYKLPRPQKWSDYGD